MKYIISVNHLYHGYGHPEVILYEIETELPLKDIVEHFNKSRSFDHDKWYQIYTSECSNDAITSDIPRIAYMQLLDTVRLNESCGNLTDCCDSCFTYITIHNVPKNISL